MIAHETNTYKEVALERLKSFMTLRERATAKDADADALYEFASRLSDPSEAWRFYCLAAHNRHPAAQYELANQIFDERNSYAYDDPTDKLVTSQSPVDLIRAYVWYTLAMPKKLEAGIRLELLAEEMTTEQVTKAKRLAAEWQPNPAECKLKTVKSTD